MQPAEILISAAIIVLAIVIAAALIAVCIVIAGASGGEAYAGKYDAWRTALVSTLSQK